MELWGYELTRKEKKQKRKIKKNKVVEKEKGNLEKNIRKKLEKERGNVKKEDAQEKKIDVNIIWKTIGFYMLALLAY